MTPLPPLAAATTTDARSLVLVLAAAAVGAILSRLHARVVLPTVVLEIVLGIAIGAEGFGWAEVTDHIDFLSDLGLVALFFFAGLELVEQRVRHRSLVRGTIGWGISLALGILVGVVLYAAGLDAVLLIAFGAVVLVAAVAALRARPPRIVRVLQQTVHTTGQAAVRLSILIMAVFVYLAIEAGFDFVLGAFAAGLIVGLAFESPEAQDVRTRLEGVGFGFLIPIYFVVTGMSFDLDSLLTPRGLGLAAAFLALLVVVRGVPSLTWLRSLGARATAAHALFAATGLPLIVAIVGIGRDKGAIASDVGTSLIGAGMVSVLVLPLAAMAITKGPSSASDDARAAAPT